MSNDYSSSDHHQIPYFQVMEEEARNYRRDNNNNNNNNNARSINLFNFKLQKPISKDESKRKKKKKQKRDKWWRNAILFFRNRWPQASRRPVQNHDDGGNGISSVHNWRRAYVGSSISGPVYLTESRSSGSDTPSRNSSRPLTPARKGEVEIPYFNLRELNMEPQFYKSLPIYSVT